LFPHLICAPFYIRDSSLDRYEPDGPRTTRPLPMIAVESEEPTTRFREDDKDEYFNETNYGS